MNPRRAAIPVPNPFYRYAIIFAVACLMSLSIMPTFASATTGSIFNCAQISSKSAYYSLSRKLNDCFSTQDSETVVASGTWGTCPWELDNEGTLRVGAGAIDQGLRYSPQLSPYLDNIKSIIFADDVMFPEVSSGMFMNCSSLVSIDASGCNTSATTTMMKMFSGCSSLSSVDLSDWNVANVVNMSGMFAECSSLTSLDLSSWTTSINTCSSVTDGINDGMNEMFENCSSLVSIDLSRWDVRGVTSMSQTFENCSSLKSLDLSTWDVSNVKDFSFFLYESDKLESINVSGWDISGAKNLEAMFGGCSSLELPDISGWDISGATNVSHMFNRCASFTELDLSDWVTSSEHGYEDGFTRNMTGMFYMCENLVSINLSGWDMSRACSLSELFGNCSSLENVDFSNCITSPVTGSLDAYWGGMASMFSDCTKLTSLDLSDWDVSGVIKMNDMFYHCSSLKYLDMSGWNTSAVRDNSYMFSGCSPNIVRVGEGYVMSKSSFPYENTGFKWRSSKDGLYYSKDEIVQTRGGIADEYIQENPNATDISACSIDLSPTSFVYDGSAKRPDVVVSISNKTLVEGTDYLLGYSNNVESGSASVVVTGLGDYRGRSVKSFGIAKAQMTPSVSIEGWTYGDAPSDPLLSGNKGNGKVTFSYARVDSADAVTPDPPSEAGKYIVYASIDETSNYLAAVTEAEFEVYQADISASSVSLPKKSVEFNGSPRIQEPQVVLGDAVLLPDSDYVVSYSDNVLKGTAKVIVRGVGNYCGSASATFEILSADLSSATVKLPSESYTYTGGAIEPIPSVWLENEPLVLGRDYSLSYSNNTEAGTATVTVTGVVNCYGSASAAFQIVPRSSGPTPEPKPTPTPEPSHLELFRLYNPYSGEHFYTASIDERYFLSSVGWNYEGVGWVAPEASNTPVYRLYNPYAGDHHYTSSAFERDSLKAVGWNDEGVGWYSDDACGVAVYRQYNPYATVGTHNYTTSRGENDMLVSVGWRAEGIGWYGIA